MSVTPQAPVTPDAILSGIGLAERNALATFTAMLPVADGRAVMKRVVKALRVKATILEDTMVNELQAAVEGIAASQATDDELRHQYWHTLTMRSTCQAKCRIRPDPPDRQPAHRLYDRWSGSRLP